MLITEDNYQVKRYREMSGEYKYDIHNEQGLNQGRPCDRTLKLNVNEILME
jgi:hypothetical protein